MPDVCTITIEGNHAGEYRVGCNQVQYIDRDSLKNTSSSTIYLYPLNSSDTYPRIALEGNYGQIYYYTAYNSYSSFTPSNIELNLKSQLYYYQPVYSLLITGLLLLIWLTKLFRRN